MLSFAAKRGYSHQDRLSMRHHAHPFKLADVYTRDAQARDLRLLDKLTKEIRGKVFLPDESRAGRLSCAKRQRTDGAATPDFEEKDWSLIEDPKLDRGKRGASIDRQEDEPEGSDGEGGSHITTDSSFDSSSGDEEERALVPRQFLPPVDPEGRPFVRHNKSKMHHYLANDMQNVLVCGRVKTSAYEKATNSAVCHSCQVSLGKNQNSLMLT